MKGGAVSTDWQDCTLDAGQHKKVEQKMRDLDRVRRLNIL